MVSIEASSESTVRASVKTDGGGSSSLLRFAAPTGVRGEATLAGTTVASRPRSKQSAHMHERCDMGTAQRVGRGSSRRLRLSRMMAVPDADVAILQNHETHKWDHNKKKNTPQYGGPPPDRPIFGVLPIRRKKKVFRVKLSFTRAGWCRLCATSARTQ